ncbi:HEAT repeat domain-containing protein [Pseudalkalibacillus hwajinpoensis]|uniref:HEAT repeat domain-containing protein n=1 Tax=Guptibacillus hwajinpoensis TaxID=208199 RepID=UPI001CFD5F51|nr:HEAT repeat domain-containing protein [Pseudalkalibacillus hwajinpoensis]
MSAIFIIFQVFLILFLVLTVLFLFLIAQKVRSNRFDRKKSEWKKYYLEHITLTIQGEKELRLPDNHPMMEAFEEVITRYYSLIKGRPSSVQMDELVEKTLHHHYKKRLQHHRWSIRMNTLHRIEKLRMVSLVEECVSLLDIKRTSELEVIQVLRILANLQDDRLYAILLIEEKEYPNFYYLDLFRRLDDAHLDHFIHSISDFPSWIQFALIEIMGELGEYKYLPTIESFVTSHDTEFRIRSLKALVKVGYMADVMQIKPSLHAESWQERMMAAKLLKPLRDHRFLEDLLRLLTDESWWVRTTAAESLLAQQNGRTLLEDVAATHIDPFARDTAKEWLVRGGTNRVYH